MKSALAICILAMACGAVLCGRDEARLQREVAIGYGDEPRLPKGTATPNSLRLTIEHHEPKLHIEIKADTKEGRTRRGVRFDHGRHRGQAD